MFKIGDSVRVIGYSKGDRHGVDFINKTATIISINFQAAYHPIELLFHDPNIKSDNSKVGWLSTKGTRYYIPELLEYYKEDNIRKLLEIVDNHPED